MNRNHILIIILLIVIVALAVGIFVFMNFHTEDIEYETLNLSDTCAVSVPVTNNSTFTNDDGLKTYNATNLTIITYNKNDLGDWENLGADIGISAGINQNFKYNHSHQGKNILIHPDDNVTVYACLIANNTTGDVVIVATPDEGLLYHIIDTMNFTAKNVTESADESDEPIEASGSSSQTAQKASETASDTSDGDEYEEGYIAENDQDFDYDGDGVGDGSAYHSHEYYVERGQSEPVSPGNDE